jgi:hypothetical protein
MGEIRNTNGKQLIQTKTKYLQIFKHLNQDIRETRDVHCPLNENLCLQYYKMLWTDINYKQAHWRPQRQHDDFITIDELEKVIKSLKSRKAP